MEKVYPVVMAIKHIANDTPVSKERLIAANTIGRSRVKQIVLKYGFTNAISNFVDIDWRYLANIENDGTIPSLPVIIQLIKICGLPVERYFNPEIMREESAQRQRVSHKLKLCPEEFLPIIEGAIDGAIQIQQKNDETEGA